MMLTTVYAYLGTHSIYSYSSSGSFSEDIVLCPPVYTAVLWTHNFQIVFWYSLYTFPNVNFSLSYFNSFLDSSEIKKTKYASMVSYEKETSLVASITPLPVTVKSHLKKYKKQVVEACFLNATKCKTSSLWTTYKSNFIRKFPNCTWNYQHLSICIFKINWQKRFLFPYLRNYSPYLLISVVLRKI